MPLDTCPTGDLPALQRNPRAMQSADTSRNRLESFTTSYSLQLPPISAKASLRISRPPGGPVDAEGTLYLRYLPFRHQNMPRYSSQGWREGWPGVRPSLELPASKDTSQVPATSADGLVVFGFGYVKRLRAKICDDRLRVDLSPFIGVTVRANNALG